MINKIVLIKIIRNAKVDAERPISLYHALKIAEQLLEVCEIEIKKGKD